VRKRFKGMSLWRYFIDNVVFGYGSNGVESGFFGIKGGPEVR
jgi:hypothetical protein